MGKGKRKRSTLEMERVKQRREEARLAARRRRTRNTIIQFGAVLLGAAAVVTAIVITFNAVADSGVFLRNKPSMSTQNYTVTNGMLSYSMMRSADNLGSSGPNLSKSLKSQTKETGVTWLDYLLDEAQTQCERMLLLAEAARANNVSLSAEDTAEIDKYIQSLKDAAEKDGQSYAKYLSSHFGRGVKEEDVRAYEELYSLATKYYDTVWDSLSFTDEEIEKYFESNRDDYIFTDYIAYTLSTADDQEYADIKAAADAIAEAGSEDAFVAAVKAHYMTLKKSDGSTYTEEEADKYVEGLYKEMVAFSDDESKLEEWLFSDDRADGDTTIIEATSSATVYYLIAAPHRNEQPSSIDIRHILIEAKESETDEVRAEALKEAERIYEEWKNGDATEDSFAALAKEYSDDGNADKGGLYSEVTSGTMVDTFNDWCFDKDRQVGDTGIVETEYGYHVMYFVKASDTPVWESDILEILRQEGYDDMYEQWEKAYTITVNDKKISSLSL